MENKGFSLQLLNFSCWSRCILTGMARMWYSKSVGALPKAVKRGTEMRKGLVGCLLFLLTIFFYACTAQPVMLACAREGWQTVGEADLRLDEVYVIRYSSRRNLSDEVLDTGMYDRLPTSGYAVLYHSRGSTFMDSYACFFNTEGELEFSFDYEENHDLYERYYARFSPYNVEAGEKALEYLKNCNYIAHMINNADPEEYTSRPEDNVWYELTDGQIDKLRR